MREKNIENKWKACMYSMDDNEAAIPNKEMPKKKYSAIKLIVPLQSLDMNCIRST